MTELPKPSPDALAAAIERLEKSILAVHEVEISVLRQLSNTLSHMSVPLEQIAHHLSRIAEASERQQ